MLVSALLVSNLKDMFLEFHACSSHLALTCLRGNPAYGTSRRSSFATSLLLGAHRVFSFFVVIPLRPISREVLST